LNGVYLGDANLAIARMFDSRNATGGSINVITEAPQDSLSSEIEVSFGSFDTTRMPPQYAPRSLLVPFLLATQRLRFQAPEVADPFHCESIAPLPEGLPFAH